MPTDRTARTRLLTCSPNDDRENRGHSKGLEKALVYGGYATSGRNLHGREYNGMNAFMLLLHCEKEGYKIPRFCTFDCVQRLNKSGKDGEELPRVSVLRGEKSFPVMLTTFTCIHKETKEKIKYDDYKKLSDKEKGAVQCLSENASVPGVQCGADQFERSEAETVGTTGTGEHGTKD